jgi:hypothetical protein
MRIIFHVGPHKTATTSIQRALSSNRQQLADLGIHVPDSQTSLPGFHELPWAVMGWDTRHLGMARKPRPAQDLLTREIATADAAGRAQVIFSAEDLSLLSVDHWQTIFRSCRAAVEDVRQLEIVVTWTDRPLRDWSLSSHASLVQLGLNLAYPEVSETLAAHIDNFKQRLLRLAELNPDLKVVRVEYSRENLIADWLENLFSGLNLGTTLNTAITENLSPSIRQIEALRIANLKTESNLDPNAPFHWPEWQSPNNLKKLRRIHARILKKMRKAFAKRIAKETAGLLPVEVCAVFRDEAKYLAEWVQFHLDEGVSKFHLFNDASTDNFAEVLEPFISTGVVSISPAKGRHQIELYNSFLNQNKGRRVWAAFIDIDEFLFAPEGAPLPTALRRFSGTAGVFVFWKVFGSGGRQSASGDGVIADSVFRHEVAESRKEAVAHDKVFRQIAAGKLLTGRVDQGKSVVRLDRVDEMLIHCPKKLRGRMVDTRGQKFSRRKWASVRRTRIYLPSHDHLLIHHYWSRNLDSLTAKYQRGSVAKEQRDNIRLKAELDQLLRWDQQISTIFDDTLLHRVLLRHHPFVFLIGFNKSATRAFQAFFEDNGLPAVHWDQNRLTEKMLDNIEVGKRLLDGYDTVYRIFSDFISSTDKGRFEGNQFFRELDHDYPNSFFILNNRNTEDWIRSREQHGEGAFLSRELGLLGSDDGPRLRRLWRTQKTEHEASVRKYFDGNPRFAEIDIDSPNVPEQINRLLGLSLDSSKWRIVGKTITN